MAVVTGSGTVGVPVDTSVLVVCLRLLMRRGRMTIDARKLGIIGRHLVAVSANRSVVWNGEPGVVERGSEPARGCVAGIARCRISCSDVVRDSAAQRLRAVPFGLMAAVASRVRGRQ